MTDGLAYMRPIDLMHLGRKRVIGSWLVGDVLIDPGPASCIETLLDALGGLRPAVIALTHIHLDHAGATGSLVKLMPGVEVWVHERGARHIVDPGKLVASAGRLYGEKMEHLWGEVLGVPEEKVRPLAGGERMGPFQVGYTPGHASHHVSYLDEESGVAFCGDVAGVRIVKGGPVVAPTPPPDIDLEAWRSSLDLVESWGPSALVPTHFGFYSDVADHLSGIRESLDRMEALAERTTEEEFVQQSHAWIESEGGAEVGEAYEQTMPAWQCYAGLRRYLEGR